MVVGEELISGEVEKRFRVWKESVAEPGTVFPYPGMKSPVLRTFIRE
jgi:hypothetical protein